MKPYTELAYNKATVNMLRRNWRSNNNYRRKSTQRVYKKNYRTQAKRKLANYILGNYNEY